MLVINLHFSSAKATSFSGVNFDWPTFGSVLNFAEIQNKSVIFVFHSFSPKEPNISNFVNIFVLAVLPLWHSCPGPWGPTSPNSGSTKKIGLGLASLVATI